MKKVQNNKNITQKSISSYIINTKDNNNNKSNNNNKYDDFSSEESEDSDFEEFIKNAKSIKISTPTPTSTHTPTTLDKEIINKDERNIIIIDDDDEKTDNLINNNRNILYGMKDPFNVLEARKRRKLE